MWFCETCQPSVLESLDLHKSIAKDLKDEITSLKVSFESQLKSFEQKFINKVETQSSSIDSNIKSYSDALTKNLKKSTENNVAISSLNKNFDYLKSNMENKLTKEKQEQLKQQKEKFNNI